MTKCLLYMAPIVLIGLVATEAPAASAAWSRQHRSQYHRHRAGGDRCAAGPRVPEGGEAAAVLAAVAVLAPVAAVIAAAAVLAPVPVLAAAAVPGPVPAEATSVAPARTAAISAAPT